MLTTLIFLPILFAVVLAIFLGIDWGKKPGPKH
jgi:hypothetical protein